jgi:hypothetical protein
MSQWFRVFGGNDTQPEPNALLQHLRDRGFGVTGRFRGDDQGWFQADLVLGGAEGRVDLDRFLAGEEGIRGELNSWAAWLESAGDSPAHAQLMERVIGTRQLFIAHAPSDPSAPDRLAALCLALCQHLARQTDGIYQVDGQGFFTPDGTLLVKET